jgi:hypothetical protein
VTKVAWFDAQSIEVHVHDMASQQTTPVPNSKKSFGDTTKKKFDQTTLSFVLFLTLSLSVSSVARFIHVPAKRTAHGAIHD